VPVAIGRSLGRTHTVSIQIAFALRTARPRVQASLNAKIAKEGAHRAGLSWARRCQVVLGGVLVVLIAYNLWLLVTWAPAASLGQDFSIYQRAAHRWLDGGGLYGASQLAGAYVIEPGDSLYPPPILLLLLPFTVLPAALWWIVPIAVTAAVLWRLRPLGWGVVAILALMAWPTTLPMYWTGNPVIWAAAGLALGVLWRPLAVLALIKPTLAPFALIGARDRRWWIALAALGLVALAFLPLWPQYVAALLNARGERASFAFYLSNVPLMMVPLAAWISRELAWLLPGGGLRSAVAVRRNSALNGVAVQT
jgi:hypothetical protein